MLAIFDMLVNIFYIIEGYIKWLCNLITGKISERSKHRLDICSNCPSNQHGICKDCGCILKAKVRVDFMLDENGLSIDGCPKKKW